MATDNENDDTPGIHGGSVRGRIEGGAEGAVEQLDDGLVELLTWVLDTETRARIYIYLRQHPDSTSDEIAEGTGLYPSTVREALAELTDDGTVTRRKRKSAGAGNNPYEYVAISPSDLVADVVGDVQDELNTVFNLDDVLADRTSDAQPVQISVERPAEGAADDD
ncbi:winged helix-turn-helix domain-containing protein [Halomarina pelagica]|uniref:winged helix-turn-helix domain-containing protein n=1 Tax=Halomarina pelagica TaxID=2961599 RepID=UPI0020C1D0F7|nr:winged helix-turn-helix domain-containing protein [Halomarina sp. BND7]